MRYIIWASSLILLAGCANNPPIKPVPLEVPVEVAIPVATGCIPPGATPTRPLSLKGRYTTEQWAALAPGAKQEAIKAQAGDRMNYTDRLQAATSGCTEARPTL